jgi:hypothetical protein
MELALRVLDIFGLFSASQIYIRYAYNSNTPPTWRQALSVAMPDWYAWEFCRR